MKPCVALLIALLSLPAAGLQGGSDLQAAFEAASLKTIKPVLNAQGPADAAAVPPHGWTWDYGSVAP